MLTEHAQTLRTLCISAFLFFLHFCIERVGQASAHATHGLSESCSVKARAQRLMFLLRRYAQPFLQFLYLPSPH